MNYDLDVIASILSISSFLAYFNIEGNDIDKLTQVKGNKVSFSQLGCCIVTILSSFVPDSFGRKKNTSCYLLLLLFYFLVIIYKRK